MSSPTPHPPDLLADPNEEDQLMPVVDAARQGDRRALDHLLTTLLPDLRCYVRLSGGQNLRRYESMSDLTQSVCRELLEDLTQFDGDSDAAFRTWLFTIAANKVRSRHRYWQTQKRNRDREDELPASAAAANAVLAGYASLCTPSQHLIAREDVERIEAAFDRLPEDYGQIIKLACFCGLPYSSIAEQMGRSEAAVRKLLSRARTRLALLIAQDDVSEPKP